MKGALPKARICCLDLDTFFVSVERLYQPELIGKPVVIGALPGHRGVVTAASYEVREFGVRSGMPVAEAYRRAPWAIYLPGRHGVYGKYAADVKGILERYAPIVRTASIDEFFLDFRGCEAIYRNDGDRDDDDTIERVVREMRQSIQGELGLPASAGVAAARPIAKMASGSAKPAGVLMVRAGEEYEFVAGLPVRRWPGIGPVAAQRLLSQGIETLGQLLTLSQGAMVRSVREAVFGVKADSLGRDRPAFREHDPRGLTLGSISNENTFAADIGDMQVIGDRLCSLCERVCWRVRQRNVLACTVTLKLRYADFETLTRSRTIAPTSAEDVVFGCVRRLLLANYDQRRRVHLLGVALSHLVKRPRQLMLPFEAGLTNVGQTIDAVRDRFGYDAIHLGLRLAELNPTPHLDELARGGMLFDNVFCTNSICTPSRASILTGQYSHRNGVYDLYDTLPGAKCYLPQEMRKAGYATAIVGKWHLKDSPRYFDYYAVIASQGRYMNPVLHVSEGGEMRRVRFDSTLVREIEVMDTEGHSSDVLTDITLDWLTRRRDKTKPFFLRHHFKAPHDMFVYAPRYEHYLNDAEIPEPSNLYDQPGPHFGSIATRGENDSLVGVIGSTI
jgi:nucleotidyltransferase/DNA polymerase involved in DNA repair